MPNKRAESRGWVALTSGIALAATLVVSPCGEAQSRRTGHPAPQPDPTWQDLLAIITGQRPARNEEAKPYNEWDPMPEYNPATRKMIVNPQSAVEAPHADWVSTFMNTWAVDSLLDYDDHSHKYNRDNLFQMKIGSICVKENYKSGHTPPDVSGNLALGHRDPRIESLTVLWKVEGYTNGQPLQLVVPDGTKNPVADAYLTGGEWFYGMFPGCCFTQKPSSGASPCPGPNGEDAWGKPELCNVLTLGNQPFMRNPHNQRATQFSVYAGESVAGKAWFCQGCHNGATGIGRMKYRSFGDYIWKMAPFEVDPPPPSPPPPPAGSSSD